MAEDRWPIRLANIIRAVRDTELAMAKLQEAIQRSTPLNLLDLQRHMDAALLRSLPPAGNPAPFIVPGGVMDKSRDAPGPAHHARHGCPVVPLWRETPLTEGDPNPDPPQSLRTVLNENDSQVQGDTP